jgi:hypothetical protein
MCYRIVVDDKIVYEGPSLIQACRAFRDLPRERQDVLVLLRKRENGVWYEADSAVNV